MTDINSKSENVRKLASLAIRSCLGVFCSLISHIHFQTEEYAPFFIWLFLGGQFFIPQESIKKLFRTNRIVVVSVLLAVVVIVYAT